jgi:hypothetical protein
LFRNELPAEYQLWDIKIIDKPMQSVKYSGFCIAWHKTQNTFILYGVTGPNQIIFLEKFEPKFRFNGISFSRLEYNGGIVNFCSMVPNSAEEVCGQFSWDGKRLQFVKETSFDPNVKILNRAKLFKEEGKIKEAIRAYDSISFAETYYSPEQEGFSLLLSAFNQSKSLGEKNRFKDAAELYKKVMAFKGLKAVLDLKNESELLQKFGKKLHGMTFSQFLEILMDYLNVLIKARLYDDFISVNGRFIYFFQDPSEIYLLRGDAYYAKRDKANYIESYNKYVSLMKEHKKEKSIPDYVQSRLK